MPTIQTLQRFRVDRADGITISGPEKLIILVLKSNETEAEFAVAISRVDAMVIALQMQSAATETQADALRG